MEARAYLKYARISPRKVQIVLDLIRNKPVDMAMAILKHTPKAACEDLQKLLKSAMANAENNHDMDVSRLYVAEWARKLTHMAFVWALSKIGIPAGSRRTTFLAIHW